MLYQIPAVKSLCGSQPKSHQVNAFQVMVGEKHGLAPKGVQTLYELGQEKNINLRIRIICGVVLRGDKVTYVGEEFV
jgi:hypothetical protein